MLDRNVTETRALAGNQVSWLGTWEANDMETERSARALVPLAFSYGQGHAKMQT